MAGKRKVTQKEICDGLRRLAFGEINEALKLLFEPEEKILNSLDGLDLFNISEIKQSKSGMEIKFFDRFKAIEKLNEFSTVQDTSKGSIFDALEKSAAAGNGENE